MLLLVALIACVGLAMLYSAADQSWTPWALRQAIRFGVAFGLCVVVAVIPIGFWLRWSYLGYAFVLALLVGVEVAGEIGMGAQRWIDLGVVRLQPSELMKIALRGMGAAASFFLAGVRWWKFALVGVLTLATIPIAWQFLRDYQKKRVLSFLDPGSDPLGAGYHILQSKIALGSGGIWGKGFGQGSQSHLNFLPEKQTDFIFTMLAEEMGLIGGLTLIGLYLLVIAYGLVITLRCRNRFGQLTAGGMTVALFLYVFINIAMVMGLIPVVGVPLPMISYGGTVMLTAMIGLGFVINAYIDRDLELPRRGNAGP